MPSLPMTFKMRGRDSKFIFYDLNDMSRNTVAPPCGFIYLFLIPPNSNPGLKGPKFDPHLWQIFWLKYIPDLWTLT